ncbi:hypothetical protein NL676_021084 [Syzygium grande]|nr:hypothetical protein NL676_021084 [Syzygium grande]
MLRKDLPPEVREAQEKKLEGLKKQQEIHSRLAVEKKIFLRDRKIKFFERRKIERRIRRLEKMQRTSLGPEQDAAIAEQLSKLKEDLEYVRFFPKTEKYVSLFSGGDDSNMVNRRNGLRKQINANLIAAAASGKDLEESGFCSSSNASSKAIKQVIFGTCSCNLSSNSDVHKPQRKRRPKKKKQQA